MSKLWKMIKQVMVKQITIATINERDSFLYQSCLCQFSPLKKSRWGLLCHARQTYKIVLPCGPFRLLSASCFFVPSIVWIHASIWMKCDKYSLDEVVQLALPAGRLVLLLAVDTLLVDLSLLASIQKGKATCSEAWGRRVPANPLDKTPYWNTGYIH